MLRTLALIVKRLSRVTRTPPHAVAYTERVFGGRRRTHAVLPVRDVRVEQILHVRWDATRGRRDTLADSGMSVENALLDGLERYWPPRDAAERSGVR